MLCRIPSYKWQLKVSTKPLAVPRPSKPSSITAPSCPAKATLIFMLAILLQQGQKNIKTTLLFTLERVWDLIRCLYQSYHINNIAVKAKCNIYVQNSKHVNFRILSLIFWCTFDISNLPMLKFVLDSFCSQAPWQHWEKKHSGFRGLYCCPDLRIWKTFRFHLLTRRDQLYILRWWKNQTTLLLEHPAF